MTEKTYNVAWRADVAASSPAEAAARAREIQLQDNTARTFWVEGDLFDMPGNGPSTNSDAYAPRALVGKALEELRRIGEDRYFICRKSDLLRAFQAWHTDVPKAGDGTLQGSTPDDPAQQAAILLDYLDRVVTERINATGEAA